MGQTNSPTFLLQGIQSEIAAIHFAALLDLHHVSRYEHGRRKELFASEQAWEIVQQRTVDVVNQFTLRLQDACAYEIAHSQNKTVVHWFKKIIQPSLQGDEEEAPSRAPTCEEIFGNSQAVVWAIKSEYITADSSMNGD